MVPYYLAEDNLRLGHPVTVDSVNAAASTRDYWRKIAAKLNARLVEIEVVCSDSREHRRRVKSRATDIRSLVLPTWQHLSWLQ